MWYPSIGYNCTLYRHQGYIVPPVCISRTGTHTPQQYHERTSYNCIHTLGYLCCWWYRYACIWAPMYPSTNCNQAPRSRYPCTHTRVPVPDTPGMHTIVCLPRNPGTGSTAGTQVFKHPIQVYYGMLYRSEKAMSVIWCHKSYVWWCVPWLSSAPSSVFFVPKTTHFVLTFWNIQLYCKN